MTRVVVIVTTWSGRCQEELQEVEGSCGGLGVECQWLFVGAKTFRCCPKKSFEPELEETTELPRCCAGPIAFLTL